MCESTITLKRTRRYNSIGADSAQEFVYYVLSSALVDVGARLCRVRVPDSTTAVAAVGASATTLRVEDLGDLTTDACRDPADCVVQVVMVGFGWLVGCWVVG